jgi:hypothetical protein
MPLLAGKLSRSSLLGAMVGVVLIVTFERHYPSLRDWLLSEPNAIRHRAMLLFWLAAAGVSATKVPPSRR